MKQDSFQNVLDRVDEIDDPQNKLSQVLEKPMPKLAMDITPTTRHDPCHDVFRIYTFRLLKDLAKKFEITLIYRDIQATVDISHEESKRLIQENISLLSSSKVPFKVFYESEILNKHLSDMPETFFKHIYQNVLSKHHNHFDRHVMMSSASLSVLMPLLDVLKIDVLLCMDFEKENVNILKGIHDVKSGYFPVVFYRGLKDLKNISHSSEHKHRAFPRISWSEKEIYNSFIKYKTNFETLHEWYKKLNLLDSKAIHYNKDKISFQTLYELVKKKKIAKNKAFTLISAHLHDFINTEGKFLELASKEMKARLDGKETGKILSSLNTPSRISIIKLLDKGNLSAYEISKQIKVSLPTTLFHLTKLQEANIISRNKNKTYSLKINRFTLYV